MEICSNISPAALAKELLSRVSNKAHPYVLYSKEDIPVLRKKSESGISKKAFAQMQRTADKYLSKSGVLTPSLHPAIGRYFQSRFAYLILTGVISGEDKYLDKATDIAVEAVESGNMDMYFKFNNALSVGDFGHAYALAYDMLYDRFSDSQRAAMKETMEQLGEWIYTNSPIIDTWGSKQPRRMAWNWNVIAHGALGLIALSLGDHEDWLTLAIERMQGYCRYAVDATGAAMEGLHYVGFALNTLAPFDHALYRHLGVSMMDAYPAMQALPYWSMNMTTPAGGEQAAIGQGSFIGNHSATYYIINRYKQSDALWGWLHTNGLFEGEFGEEYEGNGWSIPALVLFEDQDLIPQKPDEKYPLVQSFAKGIVTARDGWEKSGSMATFTCGYGYAGCWNHPDDNTFTFYANGESFIIDLGANKKTSQEHNVLLVDGEGFDYLAGATMIIGETEQNSILEGGELYIRGNNTASYAKIAKLETSIRHFVYCGGNIPFVIACDFAKKEGEHDYSVNFYTKAENTVDIAENCATIKGDRAGSLCRVFSYAQGGVSFAKAPAFNGITTSATATDSLMQATVFIAADEKTMPKVGFESTSDSITVTVGARSYTFTKSALTYPTVISTHEPLPVPDEVISSISQENAN